MLKTGKAYSTKNGRRFLILAKKNIASHSGATFVGECTRTGTLVQFKPNGEHPWDSDFNLKCDNYTWVGVHSGNMLDDCNFVAKEELTDNEDFVGFLRIENGDITTLVFQTVAEFNRNYA